MRIAIAGISHEALVSSPLPTTLADFRVYRGAAIVDHLGVGDTLRELRIDAVPILYAGSITPSGSVDEGDYLALRDEILDGLRSAGPVDGVCLVLHGAMVVKNIWNGETDVVREVRAVVGNEVPIAVRFDVHCNLTDEFASKTDFWTAYRTAPHRDVRETLERTLTLLARVIDEGLHPRPVFIHVPLLIPGERSNTDVDPMRSLIALAMQIERRSGILNAEVQVGFAWGDTPATGASVVVTATGEENLPMARRAARELAQAYWDARNDFAFDQEVAPTIGEAIDRAVAAPERTVFLTDSGDNVTAGAPGDNTNFLAALLAKRVSDAVVSGLVDPAAFEVCQKAGVGATVSVSLGGKADALYCKPVVATGVVEHLYVPPLAEQDASDRTLRVDGVRVLVTNIRVAFARLSDIRLAGVEPLEHKIIVHKLGYLLPELRDAAPREIMALTEGYTDLDFSRLPYIYVIRPIFPLDPEMVWKPVITNNAGYDEEAEGSSKG